MQDLNTFDYTIIAAYLLGLLGLGFYLQRRASASLEDYFLGGKKMPWWALGASGMASNLDMTGTMLIVSFLFLLGPRGLFIEFRGGAVLILPVMLLWTGKWNRRSNCMTGAEWMNYRFGEGAGGHFARVMSSACVVVGTIGGLAYLTKGAGLFLSTFTSYSPMTCALAMLTVATVYTLVSGFYGVVYTDVCQSVIILGAATAIVVMATEAIDAHPNELAAVAQEVTGSSEWTSSVPAWETTVPKGEDYEPYRYLMMFAFFALMKNIALGMAMGADPKYFGARNERECGTLSFVWTALLMFRWPMMMGFAVLGVFLVYERLPDPRTLGTAATGLKRHFLTAESPDSEISWDLLEEVSSILPQSQWNSVIPALLANTGEHPDVAAALQARFSEAWPERVRLALEQKELIQQKLPRNLWDEKVAAVSRQPERHPDAAALLEKTLGDAWQKECKLIGYDGQVNPERILPAVILFDFPPGLRGLMLVALLAASMSTFDSNTNGAAAYFTRDIYQRYLRPAAKTRELMVATYGFVVASVAGGFWMGYSTTSINDIWSWLMMGLGAGLLVPSMLRFYWWRFNATGVVLGTLFGLVGAVLDRLFPSINETMQAVFPSEFPAELVGFVYLTLVGLAGAVIGTYLGKPTDAKVLEHFYRTTRPFGLWGPLKRRLSPEARAFTKREHVNDLVALPFTVGWQITLFLIPMQLMVRRFFAAGVTSVIFGICLIGMYVFWYRNLPPASAGVLNRLRSDGQPDLPSWP